MRRLLLIGAAASALAILTFESPSHAQSGAQVVSNCGALALTAGPSYPLTQDQTGTLCTKAGGGGATGVGPATAASQNVSSSGYSPNYQVLGTYQGAGSTAIATSAAVGPLYAERAWIAGCIGTLPSGDAIQWQSLGPDGATWQSLGTSYTSLPLAFSFTIGSLQGVTSAPANVRIVVSGSTAPTLWCRLG